MARQTKNKRAPAKKAARKTVGARSPTKKPIKSAAKLAAVAVGVSATSAAPAKKGRKAPTPKIDARPATKKPFWKRWFGWLVKRLFIAAAILALIPVLLTILYWPSAVHPISSLMVSKWAAGEKVERQWVAFEDISPAVWQSVMMSEDGQFCSHSGVDWNQINIVVGNAFDGGRMRGASTIPMQSVKNLYLWSDRSYLRKVLEVPLALMIDFIWGKKRTMEIYLNIAEWGPGIYGIEAASRHHFKRSAKRLSGKQAALLAVTLPNPKLRNPRKPTRHMRLLARLVESRARASGAYIGCLR